MLLDAVFAVDDVPRVETYRDRVRITVPTGGHAIRVAISQNDALIFADRLRRIVHDMQTYQADVVRLPKRRARRK